MMHCDSLLDAGDRERGQGYETAQGKFQAGEVSPITPHVRMITMAVIVPI